MINVEGGAIPEEYHNAYIVDRVNTTGHRLAGPDDRPAPTATTTSTIRSRRRSTTSSSPSSTTCRRTAWTAATGNCRARCLKTAPTDLNSRRSSTSWRAADRSSIDSAAETGPHRPRPTPRGRGCKRLAEAREQRQPRRSWTRQIPTTMVMQEMAEAARHVHAGPRPVRQAGREGRGRACPPACRRCRPDAPANRLGLARWLVDPAHPLTARVTVNRFWQMLFGTGLVKTAEDFGSQGEPPSHPELLDWLAAEFRRRPATSATRGTSKAHAAADRHLGRPTASRRPSRRSCWRSDPENRLLARGPRFRLPAEMIRDQALAVSGLLNGEIGGPSVSPYQPPGLWEELASRDDGKQLDGPDVRAEPRAGPVSPQHVHVLEADLAAAVAGRPSTRPTARPAPSAARAPTRRCRRWCC